MCNRDCFNCIYPDCVYEDKKAQAYRRRYRELHREKLIANSKKYYANNKVKLQIAERERQRKRRGKRLLEEKKRGFKMFDFAKWLTDTRQEMGMTQAQLGSRLILDGVTVSKYERGVTVPNFHTVNRIVDALGYEIRIEKKGVEK